MSPLTWRRKQIQFPKRHVFSSTYLESGWWMTYKNPVILWIKRRIQKPSGAEIAQTIKQLGYEVDDGEIKSSIPSRVKDYSPLYIAQTGSEIHPASYPIGTMNTFHADKSSVTWHWQFTSTHCRAAGLFQLNQTFNDVFISWPQELHSL
jgi:hypothetical protein